MTDSAEFSVLVVQLDAEAPVSRFGPWLEDRGATLHVVRPYLGEALTEELLADGLLVLGGDMAANDDETYPWLADVRRLMSTSVRLNVPTLGICLGGQILATALGGTVGRGSAGMEAGVIEVSARTEASTDELLRDLPWPILQGSMHRDAITTLPASAIWLAESSAYPHQAFRVGTSAWGVQFHPELSPEQYRRWAAYITEDQQTMARIHAGVAQFDDVDQQVSEAARALATSFGDVVSRRSVRRVTANSDAG